MNSIHGTISKYSNTRRRRGEKFFRVTEKGDQSPGFQLIKGGGGPGGSPAPLPQGKLKQGPPPPPPPPTSGFGGPQASHAAQHWDMRFGGCSPQPMMICVQSGKEFRILKHDPLVVHSSCQAFCFNSMPLHCPIPTCRRLPGPSVREKNPSVPRIK